MGGDTKLVTGWAARYVRRNGGALQWGGACMHKGRVVGAKGRVVGAKGTWWVSGEGGRVGAGSGCAALSVCRATVEAVGAG